MTALAVIPWHAENPWRLKLMYYVTKNLSRLGIEYFLAHDVSSESTGQPFNRARAKNQGAKMAAEWNYDTVIFHDADMLLHDWEYQTLIERAEETGKLVIGYTEYRALTHPGTAWLLDGNITDPWQATVAQSLVGWSLGGIIAITVDAFKEVGGYDERFRGWGCEDTAFAIACGVALGGKERLDESAVHLFHEHSSTTQSDDDNRFNGELLARYNQINGLVDLRLVQQTD